MNNEQYEDGYATSSDELKLYYRQRGEGIPLLLCNGISVSFVYWKFLLNDLQDQFKIVKWDYRGHGGSDRPADSSRVGMDQIVDDLESVRKKLKLEKFVLIGHSFGVQVILEYYRKYGDRVLALIPILGSYEHPLNTFYNTPIARYFFPIFHRMAKKRHPLILGAWKVVQANPLRLNFHAARLSRAIHPKNCSWDDFHPFFEHYKVLDLQTYMGMVKSMQEHSAKDVLPNVSVPSLVISGEKDHFTPPEMMRKMASLIPDSEYLELPQGSHAALLEQPTEINTAIEDFLQRKLAS